MEWSAPEGPASELAARPRRSLRQTLAQEILVVEDDADAALLIEEAFSDLVLASLRYRVVHDGEEALAHLKAARDRTVLVLLDLHVPGRDGFSILKDIKADPGLRHLPVVILTASAREEDVVRAYVEGASTFVTKPADFEEFREMVELLVLYWLNVARIPSVAT